MGNWVDITFHTRLTLVDEEFIRKMDACFAEVGYSPIAYTIDGREIKPADRLAAMDHAAFFEPFATPGEKMAGISWGYSFTGTPDETTFHVSFLIWKSHRYVDHFSLKTHTDACYYNPDFEIYESESLESKQETRIAMATANVARKVSPILHKAFGAYYTDAKKDDGHVFIIGDAKQHVLPFFGGKLFNPETDTFDLYETPEGKWICPVCTEAHFTAPLWYLSTNPETPWALPSFQKCPTCQTQYGVDDIEREGDSTSLCWGKLQRNWLVKKDNAPQS